MPNQDLISLVGMQILHNLHFPFALVLLENRTLLPIKAMIFIIIHFCFFSPHRCVKKKKKKSLDGQRSELLTANNQLPARSCCYKLQAGSLSCLCRFYCLAGSCAVPGKQIVPAPPSYCERSNQALVIGALCLQCAGLSSLPLAGPSPGRATGALVFTTAV